MSQTTTDNDGGMYALRGYAYQFDAALITLFEDEDPDATVTFEYSQDLSSEKYCQQVKYRSAEYKNSSIRDAVLQLLEEFCNTPHKTYVLYCHFKNRSVQTEKLTGEKLDLILADKGSQFSQKDRELFIEKFEIVFTDDFISHFDKLIKIIQKKYSCTKEEAILKHVLLQGHIMELTLFKKPEKRTASEETLEEMLRDVHKTIVTQEYSEYLGKAKYLAMLKKKWFTFPATNIEHNTRLFIIDGTETTDLDLTKIVYSISHRYYKKDKSPAPYIYIRNAETLNIVKQKLTDKGIFFCDGTRFNGDKFRIEDMQSDSPSGQAVKCRIIDTSNIEKVSKKIDFDEIFEFFNDKPLEEGLFSKTKAESTSIKLSNSKDIIKLM